MSSSEVFGRLVSPCPWCGEYVAHYEVQPLGSVPYDPMAWSLYRRPAYYARCPRCGETICRDEDVHAPQWWRWCKPRYADLADAAREAIARGRDYVAGVAAWQAAHDVRHYYCDLLPEPADTRIWILGAQDPEMDAIERVLDEACEWYDYATDRWFRRVGQDEAYDAKGLQHPMPPARRLYRVECSWHPDCSAKQAAQWRVSQVIVVDHHRPGDPGYGRPDAESVPASSLGQVIAHLALLGRTPRTWERVISGVVPAAGTIERLDWIGWAVAARGAWYRIPADLVAVAEADHSAAMEVRQ